ncbi:MAG: hypothetical protein HC855_00035 [Rhizobiales bacterium]|nr:hypothetical protein [Hyphomicrobiales bacterium]
MKFKRPGKKTAFLVAALAAAGGGGVAAAKYFGVDQQQLLAWFPLETAKQYMGMLGLGEETDDAMRPSVMEGEEPAMASHAAETASSHDAGHGDDKPTESDHSADAAKADDHAHSPDKTGDEDDAHSKAAEPEIPYVAPATLQSPLVRQVRLLQSVQERLARGDQEAVKEQRELLVQLGGNVSKLQVGQASLEEIYAAVTYLLSGAGRTPSSASCNERICRMPRTHCSPGRSPM